MTARPQFSLRDMLLATTAIAVWCGVGVWLGVMSAFVGPAIIGPSLFFLGERRQIRRLQTAGLLLTLTSPLWLLAVFLIRVYFGVR